MEGLNPVGAVQPIGPGARIALAALGIPLVVGCVLGLTAVLTSGDLGGRERIVWGFFAALAGAAGIASLSSAVNGRRSGLWKWVDFFFGLLS